MHVVLYGSNAFLFSEGTWAHTCDPNIHKWVTFGLLLLHASKGVSSLKNMWGDLFWMYLAQLSASAPILEGRDLAWNMQVNTALRDLFFLLATPFCCGVWGIVCCSCIPSFEQICWTYRFKYPPHCLCGGFWSSFWTESLHELWSLWDAQKLWTSTWENTPKCIMRNHY